MYAALLTLLVAAGAEPLLPAARLELLGEMRLPPEERLIALGALLSEADQQCLAGKRILDTLSQQPPSAAWLELLERTRSLSCLADDRASGLAQSAQARLRLGARAGPAWEQARLKPPLSPKDRARARSPGADVDLVMADVAQSIATEPVELRPGLRRQIAVAGHSQDAAVLFDLLAWTYVMEGENLKGRALAQDPSALSAEAQAGLQRARQAWRVALLLQRHPQDDLAGMAGLCQDARDHRCALEAWELHLRRGGDGRGFAGLLIDPRAALAVDRWLGERLGYTPEQSRAAAQLINGAPPEDQPALARALALPDFASPADRGLTLRELRREDHLTLLWLGRDSRPRRLLRLGPAGPAGALLLPPGPVLPLSWVGEAPEGRALIAQLERRRQWLRWVEASPEASAVALRELRALVDQWPDDPESGRVLAWQLLSAGEAEAAVAELERLTRRLSRPDPDLLDQLQDSLAQLALQQLPQGRGPEETFGRALSLQRPLMPGSPWDELLFSLARLDRHTEAEALLAKAGGSPLSQPWAEHWAGGVQLSKAIALERKGDMAGAVWSYAQAITLSRERQPEQSTGAWRTLCALYWREHHYSRAQSCLSQLIVAQRSAGETAWQAQIERARISAWRGDLTGARAIYDTVLQEQGRVGRAEDRPAVEAQVGAARAELAVLEAVSQARRARYAPLEEKQSAVAALGALPVQLLRPVRAAGYADLGDLIQARAIMVEALISAPEEAQLWSAALDLCGPDELTDLLAELARRGHPPPARLQSALDLSQAGSAELLAAQARHTGDPDLLLFIARIAASRGDRSQARAALELAERAAPRDPRPQVRRLELMAQSGQLAEAEAELEEALKAWPHPRLVLLWADLAAQRGDLGEARRRLERLPPGVDGERERSDLPGVDLG